MVDQSLQKTKIEDREVQETIIALLAYDTREDQANALGISRQALYKRIVNHPEIDEFINSLGKIAQQTLQIASIKAAQKLVELIDDYDAHISLKASVEVLDRVSSINTITQRPILSEIKFDVEKYGFGGAKGA